MVAALLLTTVITFTPSISTDVSWYDCHAWQMWARYPLATPTGAWWADGELPCVEITGPMTDPLNDRVFEIHDDGGVESITMFCVEAVDVSGHRSECVGG